MSFDKPYNVVFTEQALQDIEYAGEYILNEFGINTFYRFNGAVETIRDLLSDFPYASHTYIEELNVRFISLPRYPYAFYLVVNDDELKVVAFTMLPERMNPDIIKVLLKDRLSQSTLGGTDA